MKTPPFRGLLLGALSVAWLSVPAITRGAAQPIASAATGLRAQGDASSFNLEGKIVKLEGGKFTVSTEENIIFHVAYTDKTDITHDDGTPATSKDLHAKAYVKVEGDLTESGEIVAKKISIQKDSGSKPPDSK